MRVRAAQRVPPQHLFGPQIAAVEELSLHLWDAVHAPDALSDAAPRPFRDLRAHILPLRALRVPLFPRFRVPVRIRCSTSRASAALTPASMFTTRPSRTTSRASPP